MKKDKKNLKKFLNLSVNMRNVMKIFSGTIAGQIINFITLPFFTRMFGAEGIGIWTLLEAKATIVNTFSDLGITNVIMLEKSENESLDIYRVVSTISVIISILTALLFFIYDSYIGEHDVFFSMILAIIMALTTFSMQQTQICYTWINKKSGYNILMKNPVIKNISVLIFALFFWLVDIGEYGYCLAMMFGQIVTIIHMKRYLPKKMFTINTKIIKEVVVRNIYFVKYQMPTNIVTQFKNQLPIILIEAFFGTTILGYYSVSVRLLSAPINLIGSALGRVFFQTVSDMRREGKDIGEFALRNMKKASHMASLIMILIISFGDIGICILFGKDYLMAGNILRIVVIQNFFTLLMGSTLGLPTVLGKQKYALISALFQIISQVISLSIGYYVFNNIYIALLIMSVIYIFIQLVYYCVLFEVMNIRFIRYLKQELTTFIVVLIIAFLIRFVFNELGLFQIIWDIYEVIFGGNIK